MDEVHELVGTAELEFFDQLLQQSREGEKLVNPRVGKFEEALLVEAEVKSGERGHRIELKFSGLTDLDGNPFEHVDRLYLPDEDTHPVSKGKFMQKLKGLGIVPQTYKNIIYCNTEEGAATLAAGIQGRCVGNSFPITITEDKNGFTNMTIRARPKVRQQ